MPSNEVSLIVPERRHSGTPPMPYTPGEVDFDLEERNSMVVFLRGIGRMTGKYNRGRFDFWLRTIPQGARRSPAVKHIVVAIALSHELWMSPSDSLTIRNRIHHHYNSALRSLAVGKPSVDIVLMMCMCAFTFESLHNDTTALMMHLNSAKKIIDEYHKKEGPEAGAIEQIVLGQIKPIVTESLFYAAGKTIADADDPLDAADWKTIPSTGEPYVTTEDAEIELRLCILYHLGVPGQAPVALVRGQSFLQQWRQDFHWFEVTSDRAVGLLHLYNVASTTLDLLSDNPHGDNADEMHQILHELEAIINLGSLQFVSSIKALLHFCQVRSTDSVVLTRTLELQHVFDSRRNESPGSTTVFRQSEWVNAES